MKDNDVKNTVNRVQILKVLLGAVNQMCTEKGGAAEWPVCRQCRADLLPELQDSQATIPRWGERE